MGRKINPIGYRLAVNKDWASKWYASKQEFPDLLHSDLAVRTYLKEKLQFAAVSKIMIERAWASVRVTLFSARPGLVIGRKGSEIERMTAHISGMCGGKQVKIDIVEIKQPETDAQLVAESVALQMERRISFRRAMKRALQTAMDFGADGIRIRCAGRLGGSDIARAEWYREGKVPLQTLRTPIDYGFAEAKTGKGIIGVKCWVNRNLENEKKRMGAGGDRDRRDRRGPRKDRPGGGRGPGRGPGGPRHHQGGYGGQGRGGSGGGAAASAPAPAPAAPNPSGGEAKKEG